jgi:hypothetical protein
VTRLLAATALLLLAACNSNFEPQYRVRDVRILAVRSGVTAGLSADVAPGDTLVLEALVANPARRNDLQIAWFACLPAASEGKLPCEDQTLLQDPSRLTGLAGVIPLGVNTFPSPPTGPDPSVVGSVALSLAAPATVTSLERALDFAAARAQANASFQCAMFADIVVVTVVSAGGKVTTAIKRVPVTFPPGSTYPPGVTNHYLLNLNPSPIDVRRAPADEVTCAGGVSLAGTPYPAGRTVICGVYASGSAQDIEVCDPDPRPVQETLRWQWYVTDGEFPDEGGVGNALADHLDFIRPPGPFTLWGLLRDSRGGVDWVTFSVDAAP